VDSVAPGSRRERLRRKIAEAQTVLRQASASAAIKNDPLRQHLNALDLFVGVQGDIYEANEESRRQIYELLTSQTDITAKQAVAEALHAEGTSIVNQLVPRLTGPTEKTLRQTLQTLRLRALCWSTGALAAVIAVTSMFAYAAGLNVGRGQGEDAAHAIQAAMAAGPDAAMSWALLMSDNNPVPAMAACRKNISTDAEGRRYCFMPVWLDPRSNAPQ
jgi:hypothetical protein